MKPILVDLYCCAGGATKGYQRAGFHVIGVDIAPQPHYCGDAFIKVDALRFLADLAFWGIYQDPTTSEYIQAAEHCRVSRLTALPVPLGDDALPPRTA